MDTRTIMDFVDEAKFTGYQRITLPNGRVIPGTDRSDAAEAIFPKHLDGQTVLDVGCYYGFFLHDAVNRGAIRAVGVEVDDGRYEIASTIAQLWDGKVEVKHGLVQDVDFDEKFDYVLFLNVIHHLVAPVEVVKRVAALCRGTLVIEFRTPYDIQFIEGMSPEGGSSRLSELRLKYRSWLMRRCNGILPMMGVGGVEYHRGYYYSKEAFHNVFVTHEKIFQAVEFRRSPNGRQMLAFCQCGF